MALSAEEHVNLVQSLFTLDEFVVEDLKKLSEGKREAFGKRILELMASTDLAKSKGLADVAALKKALEPTKKDKDVKAAQGMLCSMIECKEPVRLQARRILFCRTNSIRLKPAMLGVFWCM